MAYDLRRRISLILSLDTDPKNPASVAKIGANVSQIEKSLDRLTKKIEAVKSGVQKTIPDAFKGINISQLERQIDRVGKIIHNRLRGTLSRAVFDVYSANPRIALPAAQRIAGATGNQAQIASFAAMLAGLQAMGRNHNLLDVARRSIDVMRTMGGVHSPRVAGVRAGDVVRDFQWYRYPARRSQYPWESENFNRGIVRSFYRGSFFHPAMGGGMPPMVPPWVRVSGGWKPRPAGLLTGPATISGVAGGWVRSRAWRAGARLGGMLRPVVRTLGANVSSLPGMFPNLTAAGGMLGSGLGTIFKGIGLGVDYLKNVIGKWYGVASSFINNFMTKFAALLGAIFAIRQLVDAISLGNKEIVGRFRSSFILKNSSIARGASPQEYEGFLDTMIRNSTFTRDQIRDAANEAMILGVNFQELKTLLPLMIDVASARGRADLTAVMNAGVYQFKFGLQDEFRRLTGFVSHIGEDPYTRNLRAVRHLRGTFAGQAEILAQTDVLAKILQMMTEIKRTIGTGLMTGVLREPLSRLLQYMQVSYAVKDVDLGRMGVPSSRYIVNRRNPITGEMEQQQLNFFEYFTTRFATIITSMLKDFGGGNILKGIAVGLKEAILGVLPTVIGVIIAYEVTKIQIIVSIISKSLPQILGIIGDGMTMVVDMIAKTLHDTAIKLVGGVIDTLAGISDTLNPMYHLSGGKLSFRKLTDRFVQPTLGNALEESDAALRRSLSGNTQQIMDRIQQAARDGVSEVMTVDFLRNNTLLGDMFGKQSFGDLLLQNMQGSRMQPYVLQAMMTGQAMAQYYGFARQLAAIQLQQAMAAGYPAGSTSIAPSYGAVANPFFGTMSTRGDIGHAAGAAYRYGGAVPVGRHQMPGNAIVANNHLDGAVQGGANSRRRQQPSQYGGGYYYSPTPSF